MSDLTAVSLFAGLGGFDLALERCGVNVVAAVEIDPDCRGVLARHFPDTELFSDIRDVTGDDLRAAGFVPGRGIITAGWPCQGNSQAGRRGGMGDPRSGLWRHVVRPLAEASPRWFCGENVPGLYSVNGGADIAVVRADLARLGYWWAERILDSQHWDVPQRRARIFFVGHLGGSGAAPVEVLLEPEGGQGNPAPGGAAGQDTAGSAPVGAGGPGTVGTIGGNGPGGGWRVGADEAAAGQLVIPVQDGRARSEKAQNGLGIADASEDGTGRGTPLVPMAFNPQTGGSKARIGYGEMPTALQASQVTGLHQGTAVRRLTPRETERLQALPDEWTRWKLVNGKLTELSDSARYRMVGNALTVNVAEWILRRLVAVDERDGA